MPIDYSRYPSNWKKEIVPRVLERDGNCCKFCGVGNKETVFSVSLAIRDVDGRYKNKKIWFSDRRDVLRLGGEWGLKYNCKEVKVVLTVAHLDHDEENHDVGDDRLAALCQWCHLNYDAKEKYRRVNANWKK